MCGGVHYGEVEGLVSVERWSCSRDTHRSYPSSLPAVEMHDEFHRSQQKAGPRGRASTQTAEGGEACNLHTSVVCEDNPCFLSGV